jgi:hypothetical protein
MHESERIKRQSQFRLLDKYERYYQENGSLKRCSIVLQIFCRVEKISEGADPAEIFQLYNVHKDRRKCISYKGCLNEELKSEITCVMRRLQGESIEQIELIDWKASPVYQCIRDLVRIKKHDLQEEVFLCISDKTSWLEIKFYDYKVDGSRWNHFDFIINIHILEKKGSFCFPTLLHFFKQIKTNNQFEKNNRIFLNVFKEAANLKILSYNNEKSYENFSIGVRNPKRIENCRYICDAVKNMLKIIRKNNDLKTKKCDHSYECKQGYFCKYSHKFSILPVTENWIC